MAVARHAFYALVALLLIIKVLAQQAPAQQAPARTLDVVHCNDCLEPSNLRLRSSHGPFNVTLNHDFTISALGIRVTFTRNYSSPSSSYEGPMSIQLDSYTPPQLMPTPNCDAFSYATDAVWIIRPDNHTLEYLMSSSSSELFRSTHGSMLVEISSISCERQSVSTGSISALFVLNQTTDNLARQVGVFVEYPSESPLPCYNGTAARFPGFQPLTKTLTALRRPNLICPTGSYSNTARECVVCPAGYFCLSTSILPLSCPAGYFSPPGASNCTACPSGSYSNVTSGSCAICPSGHECPSPSQIQPCGTGRWSSAGKMACEICAAGFYCPLSTNSIQIPCPSGEYSSPASSTCFLCPAGSFCPPPGDQRISCTAGSFSSSGATNCTVCGALEYTTSSTEACRLCEAGFACVSRSSSPVPCVTGQYSNAGDKTCKACPAGSACVQTTSEPTPCPPGQYSLGNSTSCTNCPAGKQCPSTSLAPVNCAAGSFSSSGATNCTVCGAGEYTTSSTVACRLCEAGFACVSRSSSPVPCATGWYSLSGSANCTRCPRGQFCAASNSTSPCPSGTYALDGSTSCSVVPAGYFSSSQTEIIACPSGSFSYAGSTNCTTCSAGFSCGRPPSVQQVPCSEGFYSLSGQENCTRCPAGFSCEIQSSPPVACRIGQYSLSGSKFCTFCPLGFSCPELGSLPLVCTSGFYSVGNASFCSLCPPGHFCPSNATSVPVPCPPGMYATSGAASCTPCPAGSACVLTTSPPLTCSAGTFSIGNQTSCTSCPPGYHCPSIFLDAIIPCPPNTYSLVNSPSCFSCPAGSQCGSTNFSSCSSGSYSLGNASCAVCPAGSSCPSVFQAPIPCSLGSYSVSGSVSCTMCPPGHQCAFTNILPEPCVAGRYSVGNSTSCTVCPAGSSCPSTTLLPIPCDNGYASFTSSTTCNPCPAGFECYSKNANVPPVACTQGRFSLPASTNCSVCPAGYACKTPSDVGQACPTGSFALAGDGFCSACPAGFFCPDPSKSPLICAEGYYQDQMASTNCSVCPPGHFCKDRAQLPIVCPKGFFSAGSSPNCSICDAGYLCNPPSTDRRPISSICPSGGYCSTPGLFVPCPAGTYSNISGSTTPLDCLLCPAGYFCSIGTVNPYLGSNLCPLGYYCPSGTSSAKQFPCEAGTMAPDIGLGSRQQCVPCTRGYVCPAGTQGLAPNTSFPLPYQGSAYTYASLCPNGGYCPPGSSSATPCPAGTYQPQYGTYSVTDCRSCPSGAYCHGGSAYPAYCSSGTYGVCIGGQVSSCCKSCDVGWVCPESGLTKPRYLCPYGNFCPGGVQHDRHYPCPAGTMNMNMSGLVQMSDCAVCPEGYACATGTGNAGIIPLVCPPGYYCPAGTTFLTQYACPAGTFSNASGLKAATDCLVCPAGRFCSRASSKPSGSCAPGFYCPAGSSNSQAFPCPPGSWSSATDLFSPAQCSTCLSGSFCDAGSATPLRCPAGTFRDIPGATGLAVCFKCPGGFSCGIGSVNPSPCAAGFYSDLGSSDCLICSPGFFCSNATTSRQVMLEQPCPAGTLCPAGISAIPSKFSLPCPPGSYCPIASVGPTPCPDGSYNSVIGGESVNSCSICPEKYFCPAASTNFSSHECSPGYFCPAGSKTAFEIPCRKGTYRPLPLGASSDDCSLCPASHFCPQAAVLPTICPLGYFCPPAAPQPIACPLGSFGNATLLANSNDCTPCTPGFYCDGSSPTQPSGRCNSGYYCPRGSSSPTPSMFICPQGSFCPEGTDFPQACPPGTFNNRTQSRSLVECISCPPGLFCEGSRLNQPSGICSPGFYCARGAANSRPSDNITGSICPSGSFCSAGSIAPSSCAPGYYSMVVGNVNCSMCPQGHYCPGWGLILPLSCPPGFFCPVGSSSPTPCPIGSFSPYISLSSSSSCLPCSPGMYCGTVGLIQPSGNCSYGFWCLRSAVSASPAVATVNFGPCPTGFYCPSGTLSPILCPPGNYCLLREQIISNVNISISVPISCPSGTYQDNPGSTSCRVCLSGYYCPSGTGSLSSRLCPSGFFCPQGSSDYILNPCPIGTFSNRSGLSNISQCVPCLPGYFCAAAGLSYPSGLCAGGFYCSIGASSATPNPDSQVGGSCTQGFYCPIGSSAPVACTSGTSCNGNRLVAPSGVCQAGFFCQAGFSDIATGTRCPAGYYCPEATTLPLPCLSGTFSNTTGLSVATDCTPCPSGLVCSGVALRAPNFVCTPGYFCPPRSEVPNRGDYMCHRGHYCPAQSGMPIPCPPGKFQDVTGQSNCATCTAGYYCSGNATVVPQLCLPGFYCPAGTQSANAYPCPAGRYSASSGLLASIDCSLCPPSLYCGSPSATSPSGLCKAGYFCVIGASSPTPLDGITGNACPPGNFCPEGSSAPTPCPAGTFSNSTRLTNSTECLPVSVGFFSTLTGVISFKSIGCVGGAGTTPYYVHCRNAPSANTLVSCIVGNASALGATQYGACVANAGDGQFGQCSRGYVCTGGAVTPTPGNAVSGAVCDAGTYCGNGSSSALKCLVGFYNPNTGQESCSACPAGLYCPQSDTRISIICRAGYFCPARSHEPVACPAGSFSNVSGLTNMSQCSACSPGMYCSGTGLTAPTGPCNAGYTCLTGSASPSPSGQGWLQGEDFRLVPVSGNSACPAGSYCGVGHVVPTLCPAGTFRSATGGVTIHDCSSCPAGYYCGTPGMGTLSTQLCGAGHYCPGNISIPNPPEFICQKGFKCPAGSPAPTACLTGREYQLGTGASICDSCPAGFRCPSPDVPPIACPVGFACPFGALPVACPAGTYTNQTGLMDITQCSVCPPGKYCISGSIVGNCLAGYICTSNSISANPLSNCGDWPFNSSNCNSLCPRGFYCPEGTTSPIPCPYGYFLPYAGGTNQSSCKFCVAGSECQAGSFDSTPCSPGKYCAYGDLPKLCEPGTYQELPGQSNSSCTSCPAGYWCKSFGISSLSSFECPVGHYCPSGSIRPTPCPDGTFRNIPGAMSLSDCFPCIPGKVCAGNATSVPLNLSSCQSSGIASGIPCPAGYFCNRSTVVPSVCPSGFFCMENTAVPAACPGGYYCPLRTSVPILCSAGLYCPPMSVQPIGCSNGTYCNVSGLAHAKSCTSGGFCPGSRNNSAVLPCPIGHFCPVAGLEAPSICPGGHICTGNTVSPSPCRPGYFCSPGSSYEHICPIGYYCPYATGVPMKCPEGSFGTNNTANRTSIENSCVRCRPGFYTSASSSSTSCFPCDAGYICTEGSRTPVPTHLSDGYICPAGYYCPQGTDIRPTTREIACPSGTFNSKQGATALSNCIPCSVNSYADQLASTQCFPCGNTAVSNNETTACLCKGQNRAFQPSTGSCRCKPGYVVYKALSGSDKDPESDSIVDCEVVIFERCVGQIRDASGSCIDPTSDTTCKNSCSGGRIPSMDTVLMDASIGEVAMCQCKCPPSADHNICLDGSTVKQKEQFAVGPGADGTLALSITRDGVSQKISADDLFAGGLFGASFKSCSKANSGCSFQTVGGGSGGFSGLYDGGGSIIKSLLPSNSSRLNATRGRAILQSGTSNQLGIQSPIICLKVGQGTLFQVTPSTTDLSKIHYPIYSRNSLFNTNTNFDYGAFIDLKNRVSNGQLIKAFFYSFTDPGMYVFEDSVDPSKQMFVGVVAASMECPSAFASNAIQPMSSSILKQFPDVRKETSSLTLMPDYGLIIGLTAGLVALLVLSSLAVFFLKKRGFGKNSRSGLYRQSKSDALGDIESHVATEKRRELSSGSSSISSIDLEGFNVNTLWTVMQKQTTVLNTELSHQKEEVRDFYDKILREIGRIPVILSQGGSVHEVSLSSSARVTATNSTRATAKEASPLLSNIKGDRAPSPVVGPSLPTPHSSIQHASLPSAEQVFAQKLQESKVLLDADDASVIRHVEDFITDYKSKCLKELPEANVSQREALGKVFEEKRGEVMLVVKEQLALSRGRYIRDSAAIDASVARLEADLGHKKKKLESMQSDPKASALDIAELRISVENDESLINDLIDMSVNHSNIRKDLSRKLREDFVMPMLNPTIDEDEKKALIAKMHEKGERMDKELFAEQQRQLEQAEKAKSEAKQRRMERLAKQRAIIQSAQVDPVNAAEASRLSSAIPFDSFEDHVTQLDANLKQQEQDSLMQLKQRLELQKKEVMQQEANKIERAVAANPDATSEERDALRRKYDDTSNRIANYLDLEQAKQEKELSDAFAQLKERKRAKLQQKILLQQQQQQLEAENQAKLVDAVAKQKHESEQQNVQIQAELEQEAALIEADQKSVIQQRKQALVVTVEAESDDFKKQQLLQKISSLDQSLDSEKLRQSEDFKRRMEQAKAAKAKKSLDLQMRHQRELESAIIEMDTKTEQLANASVLFDDSDSEEALLMSHHKQLEDLNTDFLERLEVERTAHQQEFERLRAEQLEMKELLLRQQDMERRKLEEDLLKESQQFEADMKKKQEEKKKDMEKKLKQENLESSAMSEDEKAMVLKRHQQQIASLDREMASEKARQQEIMKEKMAERRYRVRQQEEKIKEDAEKAEQKLREELQAKVHAAEAEQLAQIAASEMDKEKVVKAAQVMLHERHRRELLEMNARHMADVAQATSSALQQLEISFGQKVKDAEASHQHAIEGLSGEQLQKANSEHKAALQRMNDKFRLEQTSVEGRVLQQIADKNKQEIAMFERRREAELRQGANGEIVDLDPLNSATDDIAAQVLEQTRIVNEDKKLALEKLYAEKDRFMAEERLKAIAEEEAFLVGLQEEKKKAIAALTAQKDRELEIQKKQLLEIQSVEERELIIKRHQAKAQSIEEDLKAERSKQERAASDRLEKMKQRKAELRKAKVISEINASAEAAQVHVIEKRLVRQETLKFSDETKQFEALKRIIEMWQRACPQVRAENVKLKAVRRFKELLKQRIDRLGPIASRIVRGAAAVPASAGAGLSISDPAFQEQFMDMLARSSLSRELDDIKRLLQKLADVKSDSSHRDSPAVQKPGSSGGAAAPPKKK